jgi:DNA repair protein RadA
MKDPLEEIPGIGRVTAPKLRGIGINSPETLAMTPIQEIVSRTSIEYKDAARMVEAAREAISQTLNLGFVTAMEIWERRKSKMRCTTGSRALDNLLAGGIETQAITEFAGEYGVGKTQLCLNLSVKSQLQSEEGGLGGGVLYFDTEGTFSPERIQQIAEGTGLDSKPILDGITVSRAYTSDHQALLLDHAFKICEENKVKLVIVDSVITHFRSEYIGRETLSERQQRLNNYMHRLLRLAELYNLAVVVTNQAQADPQYFGQPDRPTGGHVLAHACTHRVLLRRGGGKGPKRIARIFKSPYIPEGECVFKISEKGIEDIDGKAG